MGKVLGHFFEWLICANTPHIYKLFNPHHILQRKGWVIPFYRWEKWGLAKWGNKSTQEMNSRAQSPWFCPCCNFRKLPQTSTGSPQGPSDERTSIRVRTFWGAGIKWKQPATIRQERRKGIMRCQTNRKHLGCNLKEKYRKNSRKPNSHRAVCDGRGGKVTLWLENHTFWRKLSTHRNSGGGGRVFYSFNQAVYAHQASSLS